MRIHTITAGKCAKTQEDLPQNPGETREIPEIPIVLTNSANFSRQDGTPFRVCTTLYMLQLYILRLPRALNKLHVYSA